MGPLVDRTEFRSVLREVIKCVRQNLEAPGVKPLTAEQLMFWFQNVKLEDVQVIVEELDKDIASE